MYTLFKNFFYKKQAKHISYLIRKEKSLKLNKYDLSSILHDYLNKNNIEYDILSFLSKDDPIFDSFEDIHPPSLKRIVRISNLNYVDKKGIPLYEYYIHDSSYKDGYFIKKVNDIKTLSIINLKRLVDQTINQRFINESKLKELLSLEKIDLNQTFAVDNKRYNLGEYMFLQLKDKLEKIKMTENLDCLALTESMIKIIFNYCSQCIHTENKDFLLSIFNQIKEHIKKQEPEKFEIIFSLLEIELEKIVVSLNLVKEYKKTIKKI